MAGSRGAGCRRAVGDACFAVPRDAGFTLMESLVAAAILLVISVGVITTLITTAGWYAKATVRSQAASVAQEVLAVIRSRNFDGLQVSASGEWPTAIPAAMERDTPMGPFSVEVSMTTIMDTATVTPMKRIQVTVDSIANPMDSPLTVVSFVSGWSALAAEDVGFMVPVTVRCVDEAESADMSADRQVQLAGIRVELRDIDNLSVVRYYAVTDQHGIARFPEVAEDQYWLTADPNDPDLHAKYFPRRVYPAHGGSTRNPILVDNIYNLAVISRTGNDAPKATLNVGAYRDGGFPSVSSPKPVVGLKVYAQAILNPDPTYNPTAGSSGYFGTGTEIGPDGVERYRSRYPRPENDSGQLVYTGYTNSYGVAAIEIPWTLESDQRWHIWYTTTEEYRDKITDYAGSWKKYDGSKKKIDEPEKPPAGTTGDILQFQYVIGEPTEGR